MLKNLHIKKPQFKKSHNKPQDNKQAVPKKKLTKNQILNIVFLVVLGLAHIAILLAIILSFQYYSLYPSLFGSIVAIVLCILLITDFIYFVGFNHRDLALKIISIVLASFLLLGGSIGSYFIARANGIVGGILGNGSETKVETFTGTFVYSNKYNTLTSLTDLDGKIVGVLNEETNGITYLAKEELSKANVNCEYVYYNTNTELVTALIDGNVDAIAITSAYRSLFTTETTADSDEAETAEEVSEEETADSETTESTEEESETTDTYSFSRYLDNLVDFYSFEGDLKTTIEKSNKDISKEPFNVLLIGYSRTDIGSSVGLADSIILATINPQTYTVSMTSIARDSFVPISCYGGEYDKINSGRATSLACFIDTVEEFIGMDVDYYMELDYFGLVAIVNAIGGVTVENEVEFSLDGVTIPAGTVFCDGYMALQFCRERHAYAGGDFTRQDHQKQVIMAIAKKFIQSGDVNICLQAMEDASDYMHTDLTITELTRIFNLLLNTKNYTSLDTFDLVDFQNSRITGDGGIRYYSYSMHLPLWIYQIYQGSYDESMEHVQNVMGNYSSIDQDYVYEFSAHSPYVRPSFTSTDYDAVYMYNPDPMPAYWYDLQGMTISEAMAWASKNGVTLSVSYITPNMSEYDSTYEGLVYDQSVRYGQLVSDYPSGTIYVMGSQDETKYVPDFTGKNYQEVKKWASKVGISCSIDFDTSVSGEIGEVVSQSVKAYSLVEDISSIKIVVKAGKYTITFDKNGYDTTVPSSITVITGDPETTFKNPGSTTITTDSGKKYSFDGWYTSSTGGKKVSSTADISGDATVYAQYTEIATYSYKYVNGEETLKSGTIEVGTSPTAPADPSKDGYVFDGWTADKTAAKDVTVTYTPTWKEAYNYKYVDSDGTVYASGTIAVGTTPTAPSNPTKSGYSFVEWESSGSATKGGTVTYTAKWEEKPMYSYKYVVDGSTIDSGTIEVGTSPTAPTDPEKENYTFDRWVADQEAAKGVTVTYTAQWKANS